MKPTIVLFLLIAQRGIVSAQEQKPIDLFATDSSWKKEVFQFPLSFAPDIPFEGMEEARFPKHWADTSSAEHWSYVFAWEITLPSAITERELEGHLQLYFDGLIGWQHTNALLLKTNEVTGRSKYLGKIKTFDAFFSKKPMTLNVMIEVGYCSVPKKSVVFFRLSPKDFEHEIWQKLNGATLLFAECVR